MKKKHLSQINQGITTLTYHRKPTAYEIKFGHGAMHYRDFEIEELLDKDGFIKNRIKAKNDGLIYTYF